MNLYEDKFRFFKLQFKKIQLAPAASCHSGNNPRLFVIESAADGYARKQAFGV